MHTLSLAVVSFVTIASLGQFVKAQDEPHRYYRGEKVALELEPSRVVLRAASRLSADELVARANACGVAASSATSTGLQSWFFLGLDEPLQNTADQRALIAKLADQGWVEFASPVIRGIDKHWAGITPEILIQFHAATDIGSPASTSATLEGLASLPALQASPFGGMDKSFVLRHGERNGFKVLDAANRLAADPRIAWAEPDWQFSGSGSHNPNDPGWRYLWGMKNTGQYNGFADRDMDVDLAWDLTEGSAAVKILVLDVGVEQTHPDINQVPGIDLTGSPSYKGGPVNNCDNHGTPVAGAITAILNNNRGTIGVAPGCKTLSARTFVANASCNGSWTTNASYTVNALEHGRQQGVRVTNNSNGYGFRSSAIESKYSSTRGLGMSHFASGGNNGRVGLTYPASLSTVFGIAAVDSRALLTSFSNYGPMTYSSAPGINIYTTDRTGSKGWTNSDYTNAWGTSFASPYTAGVAALILSLYPGQTHAQVELSLRACRDLGPAGWDATYGWGFTNANSALRYKPYGTGLRGTGNVMPQMFGMGMPRIGKTVRLRTERARGGTTGILALGFSPASIPFLGGRLLVGGPYILVAQVFSGTPGVAGAGKYQLLLPVPNQAAYIGRKFYVQSGIQDPRAVQGLALSNALETTIGN